MLVLLAGLVVLLPARAGAVPAGPEFEVNTYTTLDQRFPKVALGGTGGFLAVWQSPGQDGGSSGIFAQRYAGSGAPAGGEFQVNTYTTAAQAYPAVTADAAGNYVVVWQSNGQDGNDAGIFGRRYDASGVALGGEFQVNTYSTGFQGNPSVAAAAGGAFVVVWNSIGEDGSGSGVFGRRFNAAGVAQGAAFQVNTYSTSDQATGGVASDAAGNFVVVWSSVGQDGSSSGVFAQRFDAAGTKQGAEFQVNTYTTSSQTYPEVARSAAGSFLVVWNSFGQDGSTAGVFAQRFNAAGTQQGAEFRVNTYTTSLQVNPSVATDAAGNFVVAWDSLDQDGNAPGVFAQRYDAAATPIGVEFHVNTYTRATQRAPSVAADGSGSFVVLWESDTQDKSGFGIFGQRFAAAGPISGKTILLKDDADVRRRGVSFRAVDSSLSASTDLGIDPVANGAFIQVFNAAGGGDSACFPLPASGWTQAGSAAQPLYRYDDSGFANGPCKIVVLSQARVLRFVCSARVQPITYSLNESQQGTVGVRFITGSASYCAAFGGSILKDSGAEERFRARNAAAPATCPTPPASCP